MLTSIARGVGRLKKGGGSRFYDIYMFRYRKFVVEARHLSRISVQGVLAEPKEGVIRSRSQPITAKGSGGAL